jgi:hypothetical protein
MRVNFVDVITLDEIIPLVDRLSEVEREELRQFLSSKPKIDWKNEWEKVVAYFHAFFQKFAEQEVISDLEKALDEVRSDRTSKGC